MADGRWMMEDGRWMRDDGRWKSESRDCFIAISALTASGGGLYPRA